MFGNSKSIGHQKAEEKYSVYRKIVYEAVIEEFPAIEAREISFADALAADMWKSLPTLNNRLERGSWGWTKEYPIYKNKPKRFEIAISSNSVLGALCFGQLSKHGTKVRLNLIESAPVRPSPLGMRALPIISFAAATFAEIVGANEVWVIDPFTSLETFYKQEGFGPREIYHGRRIGQRRVL